jgi:hypothetical protein
MIYLFSKKVVFMILGVVLSSWIIQVKYKICRWRTDTKGFITTIIYEFPMCKSIILQRGGRKAKLWKRKF